LSKFSVDDPVTVDFRGRLNISLGKYSVATLNAVWSADKAVVVWLYEGKIYKEKQAFHSAFLNFMSGERIFAHTNIIADFERPHEVIRDKCIDFVKSTKVIDRHYINAYHTIVYMGDILSYPSNVCGAAVNYSPSHIELRLWLTRALATEDGAPGLLSFEIPHRNPSIRCISDIFSTFKYICTIIANPTYASVINIQEVAQEFPDFRNQVFHGTLTRATLKAIRKFARTGIYDLSYTCAIFTGRLESYFGPFAILNPAHRRPIWEVIELMFRVSTLIQDLLQSKPIAICAGGSYRPFIPRSARGVYERTLYVNRFLDATERDFVVPEDDDYSRDEYYNLRFLRPLYCARVEDEESE
jgi:hypothetical protein